MADTDVEGTYKGKPTLATKLQAVKYYNEKGIPKCLEDLLNKMFLENPDDIYGYMAEYFAAHSKKPSLSQIRFENSFSSRGYSSFTGHIFCIINGIEKFVTSIPSFFDDGPNIEVPKVRSKPATGSKTKGDKKGAAANISLPPNQNDLPQKRHLPFDFLQARDDIYQIATKVHGQQIKEQEDMDELIKSIYKEILLEREISQPNEDLDDEQEASKESENAITLCFDCQRKSKINLTELYLSILSAKLLSELTKKHLFQGICDSYNEKRPETWTLPVPLLSVMKCGTENPGKLNMFKTVYLAPKPGKSYLESFQKLSAVYQDLGQVLQQKVNSKATSNDGSYVPQLDRLEQIFELLQHACNAAGIDFEQDIDIVFDVGASYFYDEDKKKYEVAAGSYKTAQDLIAMYSEFIERYPVIGIIDGISFKDVDNCNQLCKALSGSCYCFGDLMFEDNVENIEDKIDEQQCSGAVVRFGSYFNNITELLQLSTYIQEKGCGLIVPNATQQGCTSKFIPDIALAIKSTFISFGAVTQRETIEAINHFIQIENELSASGNLNTKEAHSFPVYNEPQVIEEEELEEETQKDKIA